MSALPAWLHPITDFPKLNNYVSVAIGIPDPKHPESKHSGIIFKNASNESLILHLRGHEELSTDPINDFSWFYCVTLPLDEERAELVNIHCRTISKTQDIIPYALFFDGEVDFSEKGEVILSEKVNGLTCATFVLAVFKHEGIILLDLSTWDPDEARLKEDIKFHDLVISVLEKKREKEGRPDEEYIERIRGERGCSRFRPEEVAGASSNKEIPINFKLAVEIGVEIANAISQNK